MASLDVNQVFRDENGDSIPQTGSQGKLISNEWLTYKLVMRRALLAGLGKQDSAERFDLAQKLHEANGLMMEFKSDEVILLRKVLFDENPLQYTVLLNGPLQKALKEM